MLLGNPILGGITLTVLLASFLFVGGFFRVVASIAHRFGGRGWLLLSGVIYCGGRCLYISSIPFSFWCGPWHTGSCLSDGPEESRYTCIIWSTSNEPSSTQGC